MDIEESAVASFFLQDGEKGPVALARMKLQEKGDAEPTWVSLTPDEALMLKGLTETIRIRVKGSSKARPAAGEPPGWFPGQAGPKHQAE